MSPRQTFRTSGLFLGLFALVPVSALYAQSPTEITQLTSASQLGSPYSQLGVVSASQPVGYVSPGSTISFLGADRLTFSRNAGQFEVDQADTTYGDTAFSSGTNLVGAGGFQGPGDGGAITLSFLIPVTEFGLNIEDFAGGNYTVDFTIIDADHFDPTFSASGDDPLDGSQGALSFEGASVIQNDAIFGVVFDDSAAGGTNNLLFGNIDYSLNTIGLQAPPTVTPEPSSLTLFGSGLIGVAAFLRRAVPRRRRA